MMSSHFERLLLEKYAHFQSNILVFEDYTGCKIMLKDTQIMLRFQQYFSSLGMDVTVSFKFSLTNYMFIFLSSRKRQWRYVNLHPLRS